MKLCNCIDCIYCKYCIYCTYILMFFCTYMYVYGDENKDIVVIRCNTVNTFKFIYNIGLKLVFHPVSQPRQINSIFTINRPILHLSCNPQCLKKCIIPLGSSQFGVIKYQIFLPTKICEQRKWNNFDSNKYLLIKIKNPIEIDILESITF